jgi:hypothetical protein
VILPRTTTRLGGIDHADGFAFGFKNRTFLDMQFDKAREFLRTHRIATPIAKAIQRIGYGAAIGILTRQNIVGGKGRRRHHWWCKTGASSLVHLTMQIGNIFSKTN